MSPLCHPLGVNRTDRLYAIREELRRAGSRGRTAERLAEQFEVSARTIKRDISALQGGGFPVWARTGRIGGYVVDADATLPPVALTASEVSGIALALAAGHGRPFTAEARTALVKILAVTPPTTRARVERLTERVWVNHDGQDPEVLSTSIANTISSALAEQRVLSLNYRDAAGKETHRQVDPQLLAYTSGRWYLIAHCRLRDAIRWFQLDRIETARPTRQPSVDRSVADIGVPPTTARSITLE